MSQLTMVVSKIRIATQNAFPEDLVMVSWVKADVEAVFEDAPRRLLRFQEDGVYQDYLIKMVCGVSCLYFLL